MKNPLIYLLALGMLAFPGISEAMRCGNRLVSVGDTKGDVLTKCGAPDVKDTSSSKTHTGYRQRTVRVRKNVWVTRGAADSSTRLIETWIYDMGKDRLSQILTFENGVLIEIEEGDYGSGPNR